MNHRDSYCWSYTKNGQYTVKSGYWVAQNLLREDVASGNLEPSITALQAFAWKVKAPPKMRHLIWQLLTGHVAVTKNLNYRNLRCDNYFPRCGEPEESVTHAIFECPPALQVWALSSTLSGQNIFPMSSIFANMDYLFWRKNELVGHDSSRDSFPWIIWYIRKARNDKLFKEIDRDPMEIVRYAESECLAWFNANEGINQNPQLNEGETVQTLCLDNICMVDGSWTATDQYSGCGWVWKTYNGKTELMGMRNLGKRETALHSELEALRWAMECMLQHSSCQRFGTDCKDIIAMVAEPQKWMSFAIELEAIQTLLICFPSFEICHIPNKHNGTADALARNARSFHRIIHFVGCSIPV